MSQKISWKKGEKVNFLKKKEGERGNEGGHHHIELKLEDRTQLLHIYLKEK